MENISLTDPQGRVKFFERCILLNLQFWQSWLGNETADLAALDYDWHGIVKAISFALDLGEIAWPTARELIVTFSPYMERRGYWDAWSHVLNRAIKVAQHSEDVPSVIKLSNLLARLSFRQSHFKESTAHYRQAIRLARQSKDQFEEARACTNLGYYYVEKGFWHRAEVLCCHALNLFEQIDNNHGRAHTASHLGILYMLQGLWDQADQHLERACEIWQSTEDHQGLFYGFLNLSTLYLYMEHPTEVLAYCEKALRQAELTGEELRMGTIYLNMGLAYKLKGELIEAEAYTQRAKAIFQRFSSLFELANAQENLGAIYLDQQKWSEAYSYLEASLKAWRSLNNKYDEIRTMILFSQYELAKGNQQQAKAWLREIETQLSQHDRTGRYHLLYQQMDKLRRSLI